MPLLRAELERFADRYRLTAREHDVVFLLATGFSTVPQIAERLSLSQNTVHNHFKNVFRRTHTNTKAGLLALFISESMDRQARVQPLVRKPHILVVEPEPTERSRIVEALRARTLGAAETADADSAIARIAQERVDMVIADLAAKTAQGTDVLSAVMDRFGRNPRVLLTGQEVSQAERTELCSRGAADVLDKPLNGDRVAFAVLEHFIESPYMRNRLKRVEESLPACINRSVDARIENVGFGGAFVALDDGALSETGNFRVGSEIELEFRLDDRDAINVRGEIMWRRGSSRPAAGAGLGVRFLDLDDAPRALVEDFVRRRTLRSFAPEMSSAIV